MFDSPCVVVRVAFTTRDKVLINCSNIIFILGFHQNGTTQGWWCKSMNSLWEITISNASWRLRRRWRWRWWKRLCISWDMMVGFNWLNGCSNWSHNFCHGVDLNGWLYISTKQHVSFPHLYFKLSYMSKVQTKVKSILSCLKVDGSHAHGMLV